MKAKALASVCIKESHVKELTKSLLKLKKTQVFVGIAQGSKKDSRKTGVITNAELGYIHEKGSPSAGIPARPFLEPGIAKGKARITEDLRLAMDAAIHDDEDRVKHNLEAAGSHAVSEVKDYMQTADFKPLKPSTIRGRSKARQTESRRESEDEALATGDQSGIRPLINTGQLRNALDYYVEKG